MEILQDHEQRLRILEGNQEKMSRQLDSLQVSQNRIEVKVMEEGKETRELLHRLIDHHFGIKGKELDRSTEIWVKSLSLIGGGTGIIALILNFFF